MSAILGWAPLSALRPAERGKSAGTDEDRWSASQQAPRSAEEAALNQIQQAQHGLRAPLFGRLCRRAPLQFTQRLGVKPLLRDLGAAEHVMRAAQDLLVAFFSHECIVIGLTVSLAAKAQM